MEDLRAGSASTGSTTRRRAAVRDRPPLLFLWAARDDLEYLYGDPLAIWRELARKADGLLRPVFMAIPCSAPWGGEFYRGIREAAAMGTEPRARLPGCVALALLHRAAVFLTHVFVRPAPSHAPGRLFLRQTLAARFGWLSNDHGRPRPSAHRRLLSPRPSSHDRSPGHYHVRGDRGTRRRPPRMWPGGRFPESALTQPVRALR